MSSLSLYRQFDRHRQTRGPGPAIPVLNESVLMRGAVALATRLNRTRAAAVRKVATETHNGRQLQLLFQQRAIERREAENEVAEQQQRLGDLLRQALTRLASIKETLQ